MPKKQKALFKQLEAFDQKYLDHLIEDYSAQLVPSETEDANQAYRQQLLQKIVEGYYTFQPTAKNKRFGFLRTPIYHQLFKYLHKQIHFNDYVKAYIQLIDHDVSSLISSVKIKNNLIEDQKLEISKLNFNISAVNNTLKELQVNPATLIQHSQRATALDSRLNALYELVKKSQYPKSQINVSKGSKVYYSQFGEDAWISDNIIFPKKGIFVDVGAADGITFSNTYYFEKQGLSGVCFEPNPENFEVARQVRQNVDPTAIALKTETADFYIDPSSPDWSGLEAPEASDFQTIKVKTKTLTRALADHKIKHIDLLSIDTEGTELDVLKSLDFTKYQPKIIVVEYLSRENIDQSKPITTFLMHLGYRLEITTYSNLIFQHEN